ncbi:MAG: excinuclease ABC subunit C [Bacteroidales bacterium]|nr:excinuclease ABC subunit C [Bacteroidales bacterium]MBQ2572642.1 excinuclease ABC subunit C [Bacteroidales bacterium]MBQ4009919.1 excinuclease ABC subunit C [Bacteroidales bacterium]
MNASEHVAEIVKALPKAPGVYRYFDKDGTIIYVGKAKSLKNRVSSYFLSNNLNRKTQILVSQICDIEYTVVDSESEALLLENVLIKQLQPKYNILLKDDKTYPWVCITNEPFPRLLYTRQKNDNGEYFGPFASAYTIKTLLALIQQLYPIRTCKHNITEQGIKEGKFDICLDYHIGNCLGPCIGKIDKENYMAMFADIRKILRGDLQQVQGFLKEKMLKHAANLEFEEASKLKHKLDLLENYRSKSTVVDTNISNVEAFGFAKDINSYYISYLRIQNGAIIASHSVEIRKRIEETDEDILAYAIVDIREELKSNVKTIILPFQIDFPIENVKFEYPQKGDKGKILELANRNAKFYMLEKHKQVEGKDPEKNTLRKLETLKADLMMDELPVHIECFDNSNIQGTNPVASCVVFKNAKPSKKDYRHFNIKTVVGANDFASMEEIIFRRYRRLLDEGEPLPQLIVVDGGKVQLSFAVRSLEKLGLIGKVKIVGIAKRLEEIFLPGDDIPLYLDKNSESLKIIQHARDEAHRFGITFHRKKRSDNFLKSELDDIKGIGPKTKEILLKEFKTINGIKEANKEKLTEVLGAAKAQIIYGYFHKEG